MAKSMALNQAAGLQGMLKDGHKTFDGVQGAVLKNIEAARAIAAMMQTSMGPNGMNKLVINHLEKIIVSSDCATILKELEIQHPAAKLLELAAESQEKEFGDNSNFVSFRICRLLDWNNAFANNFTISHIDRSFHLPGSYWSMQKILFEMDYTLQKLLVVTRELSRKF